MKLLYVVDNFELFNHYRAFLVEMPYKYYLKDLQAEINNDKNLFPSKSYLRQIKENEDFLPYVKILDNYIYFWAYEDLSKFKLLTHDDVTILKSTQIKQLNKNIFSLLYLSCISIEMTIYNYTKLKMEDEIKQKKIIYKKLIDMDVNDQQWIADYYFIKYVNEMEFVNSNEKPFKILFKEYKNIMIDFFIDNSEKKIIIASNIELIVLIRITKENEFGDIGYILFENINSKYISKEITAITLHQVIQEFGVLYKESDFINLDEKYFNQFNHP